MITVTALLADVVVAAAAVAAATAVADEKYVVDTVGANDSLDIGVHVVVGEYYVVVAAALGVAVVAADIAVVAAACIHGAVAFVVAAVVAVAVIALVAFAVAVVAAVNAADIVHHPANVVAAAVIAAVAAAAAVLSGRVDGVVAAGFPADTERTLLSTRHRKYSSVADSEATAKSVVTHAPTYPTAAEGPTRCLVLLHTCLYAPMTPH